MNDAQPTWPIPLAAGAVIAAMATAFFLGYSTTGAVSYALDDAYIHMAMAKQFAEHGVWGIDRYGFTSSSSSLIWTATLALLFKIFGTIEWAPLAMNAALAVASIGLAGRLLQRYGLGPRATFGVLLAVGFMTPMVSLSFTGQEHVLQVLVTLAFIERAARELAKGPGEDRRLGSLYILAPLAVLARFEGLFYTFITCCMLLLRKRFRDAFALGAATLAPLAAFGAYSVAQGWYPLPNSVLMKGNLTRTILGVVKGDPTTAAFYQNLVDLLGGAAIRQMIEAPHIAGLFVAAGALYLMRRGRGRGFWETGQLLLFLFGATTFFHMQLAKINWFFRYEAYLVALGVTVLGMTAAEVFKGDGQGTPTPAPPWQRWLLGAVLALTLIPLSIRSVDAHTRTPTATKNIHEQQYQMGLFLKENYEGQAIVANDIGAVSFLADIHCIDLVGLANMESARMRRTGTFNAEGMAKLAKDNGAPIAVAYEPWLEKWGGVPKGWVKVGTWTIPDNVVVAHHTVTWYAVEVPEALRLARALRAFSSRLPEDVEEAGTYLALPPTGVRLPTDGGRTIAPLISPR